MKVKETELVLVSTDSCSRCFYLRDKLEEWCNKNGYRFREEPYSSKMTEITSVPSAIIGNDVILNYDAIMEMISYKKSFY